MCPSFLSLPNIMVAKVLVKHVPYHSTYVCESQIRITLCVPSRNSHLEFVLSWHVYIASCLIDA